MCVCVIQNIKVLYLQHIILTEVYTVERSVEVSSVASLKTSTQTKVTQLDVTLTTKKEALMKTLALPLSLSLSLSIPPLSLSHPSIQQ